MKRFAMKNSLYANIKIDIPLSLIQRANSLIMRMYREEIVNIANQSQTLVSGTEINKIYSHINKEK